MAQKALITGIGGQDGSLLAEYLLGLGYEVAGFCRSGESKGWLDVAIHTGDLCNLSDLRRVISTVKPDEIYNLASQSRPGQSWQVADVTAEVNGFAAQRLFEMAREIVPNARIFQASSADMYGEALESPQTEAMAFRPNNPYGLAKYYAHQAAEIYRNHYGQFIACGVLYNHESPLRPLYFVPQKIAYAAACVALGIENSPDRDEWNQPIVQHAVVRLGDLDAMRDWGYAGDYVKAMHAMLQLDAPHTCLIGSGRAHRVRDLCQVAFGYIGKDWQQHVSVDERLYRKSDAKATVADISKAKALIGWQGGCDIAKLMAMLVDAQCERLNQAEQGVLQAHAG